MERRTFLWIQVHPKGVLPSRAEPGSRYIPSGAGLNKAANIAYRPGSRGGDRLLHFLNRLGKLPGDGCVFQTEACHQTLPPSRSLICLFTSRASPWEASRNSASCSDSSLRRLRSAIIRKAFNCRGVYSHTTAGGWPRAISRSTATAIAYPTPSRSTGLGFRRRSPL